MTYHHFLSAIAAQVRPKKYLEIGVNKGHTFNYVAPYAAEAHAVDPNPRVIKRIGHVPSVVWHNMKSSDFFKKGCPDGLDMVFIDGWHKHETSYADFEGVFPHVINNGLIFLHDTYPKNPHFLAENLAWDTWKTALKIKNEYGDVCECTTLPFWKGLTIVRKIAKDKQLAWGMYA